MVKKLVRIATRKSPLALWQANHVATQLRTIHSGLSTELVEMTTRGDRILDTPLAKVGGKGLFVKELEQGMLEDRADIAVHSMKDVPVEFPSGLHLSAILKRDDSRDAFISTRFTSFRNLPEKVKIGTCSLRRQCQIRAYYPDCEIADLRGNINTRLAKLDAGDFDAIILAVAGLSRMGWDERITEKLPQEVSLPAVGQGAIGIESRTDDEVVNALVVVLNDIETATCVTAERAMNRRLEGGCQVPIGGYCEQVDNELFMRGLVGTASGKNMIRGEIRGRSEDADTLGESLAEELLSRGASEILKEFYETS